ncbi:MAG: glycerol-3-phosphate dehydrogenase subunit GlpB [Ardenticatenia bacterium]|nr:glycerol-3-phosphate dehydrogenase subunit GlpB [Ardenticatenia bacterium]
MDVLVIGAGLAGLMAAWQAAVAGCRVRVITRGPGALFWHAGCVDVLGYAAQDTERPVAAPRDALLHLVNANPAHPYARVGLEGVETALSALQQVCEAAGYPLRGDLSHNWLLPSAVGAFRPTCLAPETMVSGDLARRDPLLIVGFEGMLDFYPELVADNLAEQERPARSVRLDLPSLRERRQLTPVTLAQLFEAPEFRRQVAEALRPKLGRAARVGFPAVLGVHRPLEVKQDLEAKLGREVFEIPTLPPSVPGMRLYTILVEAVRQAGGDVFTGMEAVRAEAENGRVQAVFTEAAARLNPHRAHAFVLATGGLLGGGIVADADGHLREVILGLPVQGPESQTKWFRQEFLASEDHPVYAAGVAVDERFRPVGAKGVPLYTNLFVAGMTLAGDDVIRRRALDGVAVATGYAVGQHAARSVQEAMR